MIYQPPQNELASCGGKLYKYRAISDAEGLDQAVSMIRDRSLWFWHLTGQNDPKECKPKVFFGGDRQDIYRYFVNDLSTAYPGADPNEIRRQAKKASINPVIPNASSVYRFWAVCCFSANGDDPRMWDEYACQGAGIVIEYRANQGSSLGLAGMVKYTDNPVDLDLLRLTEDKMYGVFTTKEDKWYYEEEYRMVERLDSAGTGRNFHYGDIDIISVTFGRRLSSVYRSRIENLCAELKIPTTAQH